jgi:hypothetical protein
MIRQTCIATALAVVFSAPAWAAHGGKHAATHRTSKEAQTTALHSDSAALAKCENLRYGERVSCLHQARGEPMPANWTGATTGGTAGGTASGSTR